MISKKTYNKAWERLNNIAQSDRAYLVWKLSYETTASEFEAYANQQPDNVRQMLWAYAESGRLMNQRLANLACENMRFPRKRKAYSCTMDTERENSPR